MRHLAFITYAQADDKQPGRQWAHWLKEIIADFRIPRSLIGERSADGVIPETMGTVVFDGDFPGGRPVGGIIDEAIQESRFLIVICSPRSAQSDYVDKEIRRFHELHGADCILLVVIDGDHHRDPKLRRDSERCCIPDVLYGIFDTIEEELPLYVDFRAYHLKKEKRLPGWTDPELFGETEEVNEYAERLRQAMVDGYRRDHRNAVFKLLGPLLGVEPAVLSNEVRLEEEDQKRRRMTGLGVAILVLMIALGALIWLATSLHNQRLEADYQRQLAEERRLEADRSLLMIGDAHKEATTMASNLLVSLIAKAGGDSDEAAIEEAISEGRGIIRQYYEDALAAGPGRSGFMRSVYLNEQGRFFLSVARQLAQLGGRKAQAADHFRSAKRNLDDALEMRKAMQKSEPDNGLFIHALAVSYDGLGDYHVARMPYLGDAERKESYHAAKECFETGMSWSLALKDASERPPNWLHDLAVSYFKLGELSREAGEFEKARSVLEEGRDELEQAGRDDPGYASWQAQLARFDLSIAKAWLSESARKGRDEAPPLDQKAKDSLEQAEEILKGLEEEGRLTSQSKAWLAEVQKYLPRLDYLDRHEPVPR